jgi:hypothetical protein
MGYASKPCAFCRKQKSGDDYFKKYHEACLPHVREKAQRDRKVCSRCRKLKAPSSYANDDTRSDGKFPYCKTCQKAAWSLDQHPDNKPNGRLCGLCLVPITGHVNRRYCSTYCRNRVGALRKKFNLTPDQYRALIVDAHDRCPICLCRPKSWPVDHNHDTGEVYGPVCQRCNVGLLAYSNHDVDTVERLLEFLSNPPARRLFGGVFVPSSIRERESKLHTVWRGTRRARRKTVPRKT